MTSGPITSWQIDGEKMETVRDFIFSGSKNTAVGGCRLKLKDAFSLEEESEKAGLKLNIQKTKIMASGPITSWQIDGETVTDFSFGGSKITVDSNCSHEIKRLLLPGRKALTNLDNL